MMLLRESVRVGSGLNEGTYGERLDYDRVPITENGAFEACVY